MLTRAPLKVSARLTRPSRRVPVVLDGQPIQVRALARFPADLQTGVGLGLTASGLTYTFGFDFETLTVETTPDLANTYVPVWSAADQYRRVSLQTIVDAVVASI